MTASPFIPYDDTGVITMNELGDIMRRQSYFVAKSNEIIQHSRFSMTMQQNKILLYLISKIKPDDTGSEVYEISVREFCQVCNIVADSGKNTEDAKRAIKAVADKSVWVKQERGEILLRWLNRVKFNDEKRCFEVTFHEDMLPYLYDLREQYTQYSLENVLGMKSKYGVRLYELLKSYEHMEKEITFTLEDLRQRLDVRNYTRFPDFRRYVLEAALDDINEYSDIEVTYTTIQGAHRVTKCIIFTVTQPDVLQMCERIRHKRQRLEE